MKTLVVALLLAAAPLLADPAAVGMDPAYLDRIAPRMQQFVDMKSAAGYVTLVARRGQIVHHHAVGTQDIEADRPMREDSIFQIASMTKPITAAGIMILMEEGKLAVTDTVETHLPEFRGLKMAIARDADTVTLGPPPRKITIRDLITHTSGLPGGFPAGLSEIFATRDRTLAEAVAVYSQQPLQFEPGTRWQYSNMGLATLGRIIEVLSGKRYQDFLSERIFGPLGMKDSFFFPAPDRYDRLSAVYSIADGELERADVPVRREGAKYPAPEGGLYSTAADLFRFYQMMLNGGTLSGARILSPGTVELMTQLHTGDITAGFAPGMGFGYGWTVVRNVDGTFRGNSIGTYGHGGAYRTYGFIDPHKQLIGIILFQKQGGGGDLAPEINAFIQMANAAIVN